MENQPSWINNGIKSACRWCGEPGFCYWNSSTESTVDLCDACRGSLDRRRKFASRSTENAQSVDAVARDSDDNG